MYNVYVFIVIYILYIYIYTHTQIYINVYMYRCINSINLCFLLTWHSFASPYFDHYAFTHHALHALWPSHICLSCNAEFFSSMNGATFNFPNFCLSHVMRTVTFKLNGCRYLHANVANQAHFQKTMTLLIKVTDLANGHSSKMTFYMGKAYSISDQSTWDLQS